MVAFQVIDPGPISKRRNLAVTETSTFKKSVWIAVFVIKLCFLSKYWVSELFEPIMYSIPSKF